MDLVLLWMEKEGFVGVEVGGVIQLEILPGAREDGLRRRQAATPALQVRECGLNWGRCGMRGDEALGHRPA